MAQGVKKAIKPKSNTRRAHAPVKKRTPKVMSHHEKKRQVKAMAGRSHEADMIAAMSREDREKTSMFRNEAMQADRMRGGGTIQKGGKVRYALTDKQRAKSAGVRARNTARAAATKAIGKKK